MNAPSRVWRAAKSASSEWPALKPIRSLGYALGAVKDILQFVLVQSGKLGAAEMAARVNTIKHVAARVGNAIDDPTATKIVNEIIASASQLLPIVTKTHQEIGRLGL